MDSPFLQIEQIYFQLKGYLVYFIVVNFNFLHKILAASVAQSVECPLRGTEGHMFDPEP